MYCVNILNFSLFPYYIYSQKRKEKRREEKRGKEEKRNLCKFLHLLEIHFDKHIHNFQEYSSMLNWHHKNILHFLVDIHRNLFFKKILLNFEKKRKERKMVKKRETYAISFIFIFIKSWVTFARIASNCIYTICIWLANIFNAFIIIYKDNQTK